MNGSAVSGRPRSVGPRGLALIRRYDGFSPRPYQHHRGYRAIGYGHRIRPGDPEHITRYQAEDLLCQDLDVIVLYLNATDNSGEGLPQDAFDALASLIYSSSLLAYERSKLRQAIDARDVAAAAEEWSRYDQRATGISPGGSLRRRRHSEKCLFSAAFIADKSGQK